MKPLLPLGLFAVLTLTTAAGPVHANPSPHDSLHTAPSPQPLSCVDARSGSSFSHYALRLTDDGQIDAAWQPDSLRRCIGFFGSVSQELISDGAGGAFVAWVDYRSIEGDIFLQRIDASGEIAEGWPFGGVAVCREERSQYHVKLAPDGSGGVFVVWQDFRSGVSGDLYLQRIAASGSPASNWPEGGRLVLEQAADQLCPSIAPDGEGGLFLVWQDRRDGQLRIHGLRLDSDGVPNASWPAEGLRLEHEGRSDSPIIVAVGSGSGILKEINAKEW